MSEDETDKIVSIRLRESEVETLRDMIKEREAYNYLINKLKTYWIFTVAGGVLVIWALYDKFNSLFNGVVK